ncbi:MAG: DNA mismatch repair protein MutS [Opitutales bacterium]|nr:DNA mismatch repair protein MutS [Opitutales bacterium]|tara:strand:- start:678 stop:977 length:300 start_codon:yes stop_codon:yes gene_type:complete
MIASEKGFAEEPDPIEIPIDGTLDLHHFQPSDVADLVTEYVAQCRRNGILSIRLIHGKGIGTLRETVHAILRKIPEVQSYRLADAAGGGWGATLVTLHI